MFLYHCISLVKKSEHVLYFEVDGNHNVEAGTEEIKFCNTTSPLYIGGKYGKFKNIFAIFKHFISLSLKLTQVNFFFFLIELLKIKRNLTIFLYASSTKLFFELTKVLVFK